MRIQLTDESVLRLLTQVCVVSSCILIHGACMQNLCTTTGYRPLQILLSKLYGTTTISEIRRYYCGALTGNRGSDVSPVEKQVYL